MLPNENWKEKPDWVYFSTCLFSKIFQNIDSGFARQVILDRLNQHLIK